MPNAHVIAYYMEVERELERRARFLQHWKEKIREWKGKRSGVNNAV